MTFYAFRLLSPAGQRYWVLHHGTYLAQRWEDAGASTPTAELLSAGDRP